MSINNSSIAGDDPNQPQPERDRLEPDDLDSSPPPSPDVDGDSAVDKYAPFPIVGIGASAGGLEALEQFFGAMPADSGLAFVVIIHLPADYDSQMAQLLQRYTEMPVREIEDGLRVEPNTVYVIVPDKNVGLLHNILHLLEPETVHGRRAPVDYFFRILAQDQGDGAIGIILSGAGSDGSVGLRAIKEVGGLVMVQEPATARYDGMPRSAIAAELVDYVLPPAEMPGRLVQYLAGPLLEAAKPSGPPEVADRNALQKIFIILRNQTGHDFSNYKEMMIARRTSRRMTIHRIDRLSDYVRFLSQNWDEIQILFKEFLIGVTNFFRDPEAFEALKREALPELLAARSGRQPLRIWVAGCSTGEEAYSLAIILKEYLAEQDLDLSVQIFATDIDAEAVETARRGVYPKGIVVDLSEERLERFFVRENDHYRIKRELREMVVFAVQSVIKDPPFSNLDLISCRNLLIYLNEKIQPELLQRFHYSLKKDGLLFLGTSEFPNVREGLFAALNRKWKIFRRRGEASARPQRTAVSVNWELLAARPGQITGEDRARILVEQALLNRYTPAAAVIDRQGDIIYIHGQTDPYLKPPVGKRPFNIIPMVRAGLEPELRAAIQTAARQKEPVIYDRLRIKNNAGEDWVRLTVMSAFEEGQAEDERRTGWLLVIFEPAHPLPVLPSAGEEIPNAEQRVMELEQELRATQERLKVTLQALEETSEDARLTAEQLQAANEELQSVNEELETSQEDLQATNEELVTLNLDFQNQINGLNQRNNELHNLLMSIEVAAIFLDLSLRVRLYTPTAAQFINLIPVDIGRPLADLAPRLLYDDLITDARQVVETLTRIEKTIQDSGGRVHKLRILPYRTGSNVIEGVVITLFPA